MKEEGWEEEWATTSIVPYHHHHPYYWRFARGRLNVSAAREFGSPTSPRRKRRSRSASLFLLLDVVYIIIIRQNLR